MLVQSQRYGSDLVRLVQVGSISDANTCPRGDGLSCEGFYEMMPVAYAGGCSNR